MKTTAKRTMNLIYKNISDITAKIYRDDNWSAVSVLCQRIRTVLSAISDDLQLSVSVVDGGYRTSRDGMSQWKEYCLSIENEGQEFIAGTLNAHAAGSVADPFDRYDLSVVLWKA